jgi:O-antigen ligase
MIYAVLFGWGCSKYIDTLEKAERLFIIVIIGGIELIAEVILLYYLNVVPYLSTWVLDTNSTGRFNSLAYLSFDTVGLISILNICCAIYFIMERRKYIYLGLIILMFLPIVATLAKAPFTAALLSIAVIFALRAHRHRRLWLSLTLLGVLAALALDSSSFANLPNIINTAFGGTRRDDNDVTQTIYARFGLWLHGADIFLLRFPLGVGNGMVEYAMAAEAPMHFERYVHGDLYDVYSAVAAHQHITNIHNVFIEVVVENGICGIAMLGVYVGLLWVTFIRFLRAPPATNAFERKIVLMQACVYGALVGIGWRFIYESGDKLYFILLMLFFLSYALPVFRTQARLLLADSSGFASDPMEEESVSGDPDWPGVGNEADEIREIDC